MSHLLLINPNTNEATTRMMVAIAQAALDQENLEQPAVPTTGWPRSVEGLTAGFGVALITHEAALKVAAQAVLARLTETPTDNVAGIVIAAFGDPGLKDARDQSSAPVTGIAEAAMAEAPGRFAVVTTTPDLAESIRASAQAYGHGARFAGVRLTPGDPGELMADPVRLREALAEACRQAVEQDHAQSIVIGGGPLASAARDLRPHFSQAIIEPIPAAIRLALRRARSR